MLSTLCLASETALEHHKIISDGLSPLLQGFGVLTLHCVPTLPGKSRVFASLYTDAKTVPQPLRTIFRHFVCGWWEHMHGGNTILDGDAQLILGQVSLPHTHMMNLRLIYKVLKAASPVFCG